MSNEQKKYRFLFIEPFSLPRNSSFARFSSEATKEQKIMNYSGLKHLLEDVEWDYPDGPVAAYGDWPVENREEMCFVAAGRLPVVREACESGKYNAIILAGGGEPGFNEAREIANRYNIPVTSFAYSQMHIASMIGNKFTIIDLAESHNMYYYNLVVQHQFTQRCASIRNIDIPLARPGYTDEFPMFEEQKKALRGESSVAVERAVKEAVEAIEEDSAEVITFGCAATFWIKPFLQKRLTEMGWEIPVLEGYGCAIELAKTMVDLGIHASNLMFPPTRPGYTRVKRF